MWKNSKMQIKRKKTNQVKVGNVIIGGGAPISIQSMTNTFTYDVDATIKQIRKLEKSGAEIVRLAVPTRKDTSALKEILQQVNIPIVADVHFHFDRALEAIEAGVHKIRLNPGNLRDKKNLRKVISAARSRNVPIRIGINAGSIRTKNQLKQKFSHQELFKLIITKLDEYIKFFEKHKFQDLVLSAKSSDISMTIDLYKEMSRRYDYPLHLGLTHAGTVKTGTIRSAVAIGKLLIDGIGDTIRVSLSSDPIEEVHVAKEILKSLNLRTFNEPELICCPTCGRCLIDLPKVAEQVERKLRTIHSNIKVAVMGCIVNGPGEAADADIALIAGKDCGFIYIKGKRILRVERKEMIDKLIEFCKSFTQNKLDLD